MAAHTRVTVMYRASDPESEAIGGFATEWAHQDGGFSWSLADNGQADGVELKYPDDIRVFFPMGSIVRIDFEPCDCGTCRPQAAG